MKAAEGTRQPPLHETVTAASIRPLTFKARQLATTMTEYEIRPRSLVCARTGRELKPGETYYSVLAATPQGFVREDYAAEAWTGPHKGAIGFWRARVPTAAAKNRPQFVDDSVLVQFFERLEGESESQKENFRYILALLLIRKKILKLVGAETDGGREFLVVRAAATGAQTRVVNPGLTEEQLVALQTEVEKSLQYTTE